MKLKRLYICPIRKQLKAFTIAELLVVALLSLLSALAAFSAIANANANFSSYVEESSSSLQKVNAYTLINADNTNCSSVSIQEDVLTFQNPLYQIFYSIDENHIIRYSSQASNLRDTILVGFFSWSTFYNNLPVFQGNVDRIEISGFTPNGHEELKFNFSKPYSAQNLMNGD